MKKILAVTLFMSILVSCKKEVQNTKEIKVQNKSAEAHIKQKIMPEIIKINTITFKNEINGKDVQLLDVRTPDEYNEGHIAKAKNINIYDDDFLQQVTSLSKSKPVYVYCRSGARSMKAANKLKDAGFKVYNLNGGIKGWLKKGFQQKL
ncbi:MAG: rhodanese-like domain-containing protein [Flavobacteriaceae bacterium]|nr:rhodanese-like domain-containing protein [Flavobacteriaceae bacterium]